MSLKKDGILCTNCVSEMKIAIPAEFKDFLEWIKKNPPPQEASPRFSPEIIRAARKALQAIIVFHMEEVPKSLKFIEQ